MRVSAWLTFAAVGAAALGVGGCSDNGGTGPSVSLSGTYTLVSIQFPPQPAITPPNATGTFTLTQTTYTLHLVTPQGTVDDTGTYTISGSQWSQSSATTGQATGTYTLSGKTLTVNATAQGVTSISVWQKQ